MPHETTLITTIAIAFVLAFALAFLAWKLRISPIVGYLFAGVLIGPFTPGFVADISLARQLAEVGVILLMFGAGLHLSVKDLMAVRGVAIPGAIAQMLLTTLLGAAMASLWGWKPGTGFIFGFSLSVASTVVLLRALEQRNALSSPEGHVAVGWLIVQDLMMVIALVLLPALADTLGGASSPQARSAGADLWMELALTLGKIAIFVAFALIVGTRAVPWVLMQVARTGSRELFTLAVLAVALGIASGSAALFDVSFSVGAFFAGLILSESDLSHKAGQDSLPLQDAFAVLFFVSVGMLFDPTILLREPLAVLAVLLVIVIGNSVAALLLVLAFRYPVSTALTVSAGVAQIGEFSFILAALGVNLGLLPTEGRDLILAGSILSITLNPAIFAGMPMILRVLRTQEGVIRFFERLGEPRLVPARESSVLSEHAVIIGHGRVGGVIAPLLQGEGLPFIVVERDRLLFESLQRRGVRAVYGDATARGVLDAAQIASARLLIVASPDGFQTRRILELARAANPHIETVVRTHSEEELAYLKEQGVGLAVMGERELARGMGEHVLRVLGVPPARAQLLVQGESPAELAEKAERL